MKCPNMTMNPTSEWQFYEPSDSTGGWSIKFRASDRLMVVYGEEAITYRPIEFSMRLKNILPDEFTIRWLGTDWHGRQKFEIGSLDKLGENLPLVIKWFPYRRTKDEEHR